MTKALPWWAKPGTNPDVLRRSIADAKRKRLAAQRAAVEAGNLAGLVDALAEAQPATRGRASGTGDELLVLPRWAVEAAGKAVLDVLNGHRPGAGRGRTANASARYVQDQIDLVRYLEVETWRRIGRTKERAMAEAARSLEALGLGASPDTIRSGHKRVARRLRTEGGRFYAVRSATVDALLAPVSRVK